MKSGKLKLVALVTAFQCGFLAQASSAAEFVIASGGHAKAVISLPANPSVSLSYAAKELSSYLESLRVAGSQEVHGSCERMFRSPRSS